MIQRGMFLHGVLFATIACGVLVAGGRADPPAEARAFEGKSTQLKRTVLVPTLDTPSPAGKNVIWCASFQLAWNVLRDDVVGGPILVTNAEAVAKRLNDAPVPSIPEDARFFAAGKASSELLDTIVGEMQRRFPDAPPPRLGPPSGDLLAYAYLAANVAFAKPYHPDAGPYHFFETFSDDGTPVKGFGFRFDKHGPPDAGWVEQVGVLYAKNLESLDEKAPPEFVLDLDRTSSPYQLLAARIEPGDTLAATIVRMESLVSAYAAARDQADTITGGELCVPFLDWRIEHRFQELEGADQAFRNPGFEGFHIAEAYQMVDFRLDEGGARLKSEAVIRVRGGPRRFVYGLPFLLALRVRGEKWPFLAVWVQNAEWLTKA